MKNTSASQDFILTAVRANGDVLRYASGWHLALRPRSRADGHREGANTNQRLGDAVRVVRFVAGYTLMRICGGFPCCSLCGYQTPAACGATWMKETLYH